MLVDNSKKNFFSKLKNDYTKDKEVEQTKKFIRFCTIKIGKKSKSTLFKMWCNFFNCFFEQFIEVSIKEFDINLLFCVCLPGYTWLCAMKYTGINLKTFQGKELILTLENSIRVGISTVFCDRDVLSDKNKDIM